MKVDQMSDGVVQGFIDNTSAILEGYEKSTTHRKKISRMGASDDAIFSCLKKEGTGTTEIAVGFYHEFHGYQKYPD
jgi:hypothetical protein